MTSPDGRPPSLRLRPSAAAGKANVARVVPQFESRYAIRGTTSSRMFVSTCLGEGNGRCASSFVLPCRRRGRAAGRHAHHAGAILPIPARACDRRFGRRRRPRHRGAPNGAMVVGAARPAVHRREPAGSLGQSCPRGSGQCACRRPHARASGREQRDQRQPLQQARLRVSARHRAGRRRHARAAGDGGQSVVSRNDGPAIHRLCQGQPGQDQHGVGRRRHLDPCFRRAVQDADRDRDAARALSRRGAGSR